MRRNPIVLIFVFLCVTAMALAANKFGVAERRTVELDKPAHIADTLVPAGKYEVRHTMEGDQHIMIFTSVGAPQAVTVRAKCTLVAVEKPVQQTEMGFKQGANGDLVLVRMQFKGDKAIHMF